MSREKKRKMDGIDAQAGGGGEAAPSSAPAVAASSVHPSAERAAAAAESDDRMRDAAEPNSDEDDDAEGSADAAGASAAPTSSPEAVAALLESLPATLSVLAQLRADAATCKDPRFHALRKEVLRLAATIQNVRARATLRLRHSNQRTSLFPCAHCCAVLLLPTQSHFTGETKDDRQKRLHRRKEKGDRLARELRQKTADQKHINSVALRNARIQALNAMIEPSAWGEKKGEEMLLMPGSSEGQKLLTAEGSEPDSAALSLSASPSPSPSLSPEDEAKAAARAVALANAAGPQSFVYPTIAPASALAELVAGDGSAAAAISPSLTKPFVRTGGVSALPAKNAAAATESAAAPAPIIVPALVSIEDEPADAEAATGSKKKKKGGERQAKKAAFQQEGVHVNQEVLRENNKKEQAAKAAKAAAAAAAASSTTAAMQDTPAAAAASSSSAAAPLGFTSDPVAPAPSSQPEFGPQLNNPRSCYCCKARFFQLHFFYSEFCASCARLNFAKRNQLADLRGKVMLLTGSRVKIGFRCGLRLLRCGALLIATSRFPHDTAKRYAAEPDFAQWKDRLHIYGLDLRDLKSVVKLSEILSARYDRLDAIINNAAQTVRRPPMYYRHLLPIECLAEEQMPKEWKDVVRGDLHELAQRARLSAASGEDTRRLGTAVEDGPHTHGVMVEDISDSHVSATTDGATVPHSVSHAEPTAAPVAAAAASSSSSSSSAAAAAPVPSASPVASMDVFARNDDLNASLLTTSNRAAALSQLTVLPGDQHQDSALFPLGRFDVTGQQLDLRSVNSWNLKLDQVDPSELVEVFAINGQQRVLAGPRLDAVVVGKR